MLRSSFISLLLRANKTRCFRGGGHDFTFTSVIHSKIHLTVFCLFHVNQTSATNRMWCQFMNLELTRLLGGTFAVAGVSGVGGGISGVHQDSLCSNQNLPYNSPHPLPFQIKQLDVCVSPPAFCNTLTNGMKQFVIKSLCREALSRWHFGPHPSPHKIWRP